MRAMLPVSARLSSSRGRIGMATPSRALTTTRESLHRLCEHVVSPARHAVTGRIGLRPAPCGVRTPPFGDDDRVVEVDGAELVVRDRAGERRTTVTTLRAAGDFVGVPPGAPADVYHPATPCDLDAPLALDPGAMKALADCYDVAASALAALSARIPDDEPTEAQLWPEHLDLAISAAGVNYGVSPGDDAMPEPYAYVGPHGGPPSDDPFWNAPFGAARPMSTIHSADELAEFFLSGRSLAGPTTREE